MGRSGTNNGGGLRWADMPRHVCPRCGLSRPAGYQQIRDNSPCNSRSKCDARIAAKKAREKRAKDKLKRR